MPRREKPCEPCSPDTNVATMQEPAIAPADHPVDFSDMALEEAKDILRSSAPTMIPPSEQEEFASSADGIAAWHNNQKITGLWSNRSNGNSYIAIAGMGWKRLSPANDSALVNLTMLAAHAAQINANVNIRIEADGMVHELYVWS